MLIDSPQITGSLVIDGDLHIPFGPDSTRPTSPISASLRYNTQSGSLELWNGNKWSGLQAGNSGPSPYTADFLIEGGGGGGGGDMGGGGGAGGLRTSFGSISGRGTAAEDSISFSPGTTYVITVGPGGAKGSGTYSNNATSGTASSLIGGELNIISLGGGKGAARTSYGAKITGGSGGSGGGGSGFAGGGTGGAGGAGTSGQGYNGGSGISAAAIDGGGGGGGTGGVGESAFNDASSGDGGVGTANSITGTSIFYGGGGGGSGYGAGNATGGNGGGGGSNTNGTANTGGGGGGSSTSESAGNGGSGVVIIRVPTANYSGTTTGSPTVTTDGTDTILKFTQSGTYTA